MYWIRVGRATLYPLGDLLASSYTSQRYADCIKFIANRKVGPISTRGGAVTFRVGLRARTHAPPH